MAKRVSLPVYDCDHCGACCRTLIVEADHLDVLREPRIATEATTLDGHGRLSLEDTKWGLTHGVGRERGCVFLGTDNLCGIYATRPNECVACPAGGEKCQQAREWAKLPPLQPTKREPTLADKINALGWE